MTLHVVVSSACLICTTSTRIRKKIEDSLSLPIPHYLLNSLEPRLHSQWLLWWYVQQLSCSCLHARRGIIVPMSAPQQVQWWTVHLWTQIQDRWIPHPCDIKQRDSGTLYRIAAWLFGAFNTIPSNLVGVVAPILVAFQRMPLAVDAESWIHSSAEAAPSRFGTLPSSSQLSGNPGFSKQSFPSCAEVSKVRRTILAAQSYDDLSAPSWIAEKRWTLSLCRMQTADSIPSGPQRDASALM